MTDNIKNIFEIYESILANKKIISEASLSSPIAKLNITSQFGVKRSYETHPGVDLSIPSGSEVRSPEDGIVIDQADDSKRCGGKIFIDHQNGYKSRYCHMKDIKVKKGDKVTKGQLIGLSGGAKGEKGAGNSTGPHLHFEVYKDGKLVNPMDHIDREMAVSDDNISGDTTYDKSDNIGDNIVGAFIDQLISNFAPKMNEEKIYGNFGKNIKNVGGSILLDKNKNVNIYSPVSGKINNIRINSSCKNQITIFHDVNDKEYRLEFCGISRPYVSDGDSVSKGTILGKTSDDVIITLYNDRLQKIDLDKASKMESKKSSKEKEEKEKNTPQSSYKSKTGYQDPTLDLLGSVLSYPFRYKEKEKEDKSKISKFASPTSKNQPEPGFLLNMFKKKKVDENIERIKKLLK